jgi:DNA-binding beta-propeller fold protein YncE
MKRRTFIALGLSSPAVASRMATSAFAASGGTATPVAAVTPITLEFLWVSTGGPDPFSSPYGIGIAPDGNVWVADGFNVRFQILAPDGSFLETWGTPGAGAGQFNFETFFGGAPTGYGDVAWDAAGNSYVADVGNRRVQKFGPDREFLLAWGSEGDGTGDGQLQRPSTIAVDDEGVVYVTDEWRSEVQRFDGEGRFLGKFGGFGSEDGEFMTPSAVAIDDAGDVWMTDWSRHRIQRFSPEGELLDAWGVVGSKDGELTSPNDIAFDDEGRVYVWDDRNFRISVFTRDGEFLFATKGYGLEPGQFLSGADLAYSDGVLYVSDMGRHDVQAFRVVAQGASDS